MCDSKRDNEGKAGIGGTALKIRLITADDNSFVREGMKIILSTFPEFEVLAAVDDGHKAVEFCEHHEVDIALLDIQMPVMNGVEAAKRLAERTGTKVLILTTFDAIKPSSWKPSVTGPRAFKNNDPEQIRNAIISVHNGHNVLQHAVLDKLKTGLTAEKNTDADRTDKIDRRLFTEREFEIISLIAKGLSNREISKTLFISEGTIANHITSILSKTGLTHRTQIAIYYLTGKIE